MQLLDEVIHSFYSRRFYYDLIHDRADIGIRYMVLLIILSTVLLPLYLWQDYPAMHPVIKALPVLAETMPAIVFENDKISIDKPVPFRLNLGTGTDPLWIIIDPSYAIIDTNSLARVLRQDNVAVLLTADRLIVMKDQQGTLEMCDLKWIPPFFFGFNQWKVLGSVVIHRGLSFFTVIFMAVTLVLVTLYTIVATVLTAAAAKVVSWVIRAHFNFKSALRLAAIMRIPATIVTAVPVLVGMPLSSGLSNLVWLGYLVFVVFCAREPNLLSKDR